MEARHKKSNYSKHFLQELARLGFETIGKAVGLQRQTPQLLDMISELLVTGPG